MKNAYDYRRDLAELEALNASHCTALACLPVCPIHGEQLDLQPPRTYEQEYCGTWYICPQCNYTVLYRSVELLRYLAH